MLLPPLLLAESADLPLSAQLAERQDSQQDISLLRPEADARETPSRGPITGPGEAPEGSDQKNRADVLQAANLEHASPVLDEQLLETLLSINLDPLSAGQSRGAEARIVSGTPSFTGSPVVSAAPGVVSPAPSSVSPGGSVSGPENILPESSGGSLPLSAMVMSLSGEHSPPAASTVMDLADARLTVPEEDGGGQQLGASGNCDIGPAMVKVESVSFVTPHEPIRNDFNTVIYSAPQWLDQGVDGNLERNWPTSYTRENTGVVSATFVVDPALDGCSLLVKGDSSPPYHVPAVSLVNGGISNIALTTPFLDTVGEVGLAIYWKASSDGGTTWVSAGETSHQIYLTYADPEATPFESLIYMGSEGAQGKKTEQDTIDGAWRQFASRTAGGKNEALRYYDPWSGPTLTETTLGLLGTNNGNCTAFARLWIDILAVQGITRPADNFVVWHAPGEHIFIANWVDHFDGFPGSSTLPGYEYVNEFADAIWIKQDPATGKFYYDFKFLAEEVSDLPGVAGQNSADPASLFENHVVAKFDNKFYDPSYGNIYNSSEEFENSMVVFLGKQGGPNNDANPNPNKFDIRHNPPGNQIVRDMTVTYYKPIKL